MLGKLFRTEWKATSRWLVPLHLILLIVTIMGKILLSLGLFENESFVVLTFLSTTFYVLLIMATGIITMVLLVMRFYKSLFTDEGYLTFTLPVTSHQLLISKIGVSCIWYLINLVAIVLSIFILLLDGDTYKAFMNAIPQLNEGLKTILGFSGIGAVIFIIVYIIIAVISSFMMFSTSICIGQLMSKHKILGSILSYIGIYMIIQTVSSIAMFAFGAMTTNMNYASEAEVLKVYQIMMPSTLCFLILQIAIYYTVSNFIMKRKINLD